MGEGRLNEKPLPSVKEKRAPPKQTETELGANTWGLTDTDSLRAYIILGAPGEHMAKN